MATALTAKQALQKAYLQAAAPQAVYEWLRTNAPIDSVHDLELPEQTQQSLLDRSERLIDLALGEFGTNREVLKALFERGDDEIRCAVLANRFLGTIFDDIFGRGLFSPDKFEQFLQNAPYANLQAFLTNPTLPARSLASALRREGPYERLSDDQWKIVVFAAGKNPQLRSGAVFPGKRAPLSEPWGLSEAIQAAWSLLDRVPVTDQWVAIVSGVFDKIAYRGPPRDIPLPEEEDDATFDSNDLDAEIDAVHAFQERLRPVEIEFVSDAFARWQSPDEDDAVWNHYGELRRKLASTLARDHFSDVPALLRDHEDRFVRQGYYEQFEPRDLEEVVAAHRRDGQHFTEAAIENPYFYKRGNEPLTRLLYTLVHDPAVKTASDSTWIPLRFSALGNELASENLDLYAFDELSLMRPPEPSDSEDDSLLSGPRSGGLARRIYDLTMATRNGDEPEAVDEAVGRLEIAIGELQTNADDRLDAAVARLERRIESLHEGRSRPGFSLGWVVLLIGVVLLLLR